eukprot:RCo053302
MDPALLASGPDQSCFPLFQLERFLVGKNNRRYVLGNELLGKGGFGYVYPAVDEATGAQVAVKEVLMERDTHVQLREVSTLRKLENGHRNIVKLFEVIEYKRRLLLVMERLSHSLDDVIRFAGKIQPGPCRKYLSQILCGLDYLHSEVEIVHRDLKPANVMLSAQKEVKLCDFGLSRPAQATTTTRTTGGANGTPFFIPPETAFKGKRSHYSWDIWSLGIMLVVMLTGKPPVPYAECEDNLMALFMRIATVSTEELLPTAEACPSEALRDLIKLCLNRDPMHRPTCRTLQQHPFLAETTSPGNSVEEMDGSAEGSASSLQHSPVALVNAAWNDHRLAISMLDHGGNVGINDRDSGGHTALMNAAMRGWEELVLRLMQAKADLEARTNLGNTALHEATRTGRHAMVKLLIDAKADLEATNNAGETAMHLAGAGGQDPSAVALFKANARVHVLNQVGKSPADLAEESGHTLLGEWLIARAKEQEQAATAASATSTASATGTAAQTSASEDKSTSS